MKKEIAGLNFHMASDGPMPALEKMLRLMPSYHKYDTYAINEKDNSVVVKIADKYCNGIFKHVVVKFTKYSTKIFVWDDDDKSPKMVQISESAGSKDADAIRKNITSILSSVFVPSYSDY